MGIDKNDFGNLSRCVSHALRHEPWVYQLDLDEEGWVSIDQLLQALRAKDERWRDILATDLREMIVRSSKRRHEIRNDHVRAIYGHSIPQRLTRKPASPPEILFHGTSPSSLSEIRAHGLRSMARHHVHLSTDEVTALEVGKRKSTHPVSLRVYALKAYRGGVRFYEGNDKVWLADDIPLEFIEF